MKTIIRVVAIATILLNYTHSYSQSTKSLPAQPATKVFSGEIGEGKIIYNYYEDTKTGDRVRHGAFKYSEYTASEGAVYSVLFTGTYKNGFKEGSWKYLITRKDIPLNEGVYQTGSISVLMSYKAGMPNGLWTYSENYKLRKRHYASGGWVWGPFEVVPGQNVTMNFSNGTVVGLFKMKSDYQNVTGLFDNNGLMTGKWSITDVGVSQTDMEALNGIVFKYIKRDVSTGKVIFKQDFDSEVQATQLSIRKLSRVGIDSLCQVKQVRIDTLPSLNLFDYKEFFNNRIFMHNETGGDKTIVVGERETFDTKNYGKYILVERIK